MKNLLVERFENPPFQSLEYHYAIEAGNAADYHALAEHHYRAQRPATMTRVLRMVHPMATASSRFLGQQPQQKIVAVLVESLPALQCVLRDQALCNRYGGLKNPRSRGMLLNDEMRCISRVVVHPQYRGLGLAVKLVKAALASATTIYTESIAAMGHVHPFFERAGMKAYQRPAHAHDQRLAQALTTSHISLIELSAMQIILKKISQMPEIQRQWFECEVQRWYRTTLGRSNRYRANLHEQLCAARQRLLCEPIYYLHDNRVAR